MLLIAYFEDATSATYGATGDRPIVSLMSVADTAAATLNTETGFTYITITDFVHTDDYKISWVSSAWTLVARDALSTVATWNMTSITANGTDVATFGSGLPNPSTVHIELQAQMVVPQMTGTVTTGSLSITADYAGTYLITINIFPYKNYSQVIAAT